MLLLAFHSSSTDTAAPAAYLQNVKALQRQRQELQRQLDKAASDKSELHKSLQQQRQRCVSAVHPSPLRPYSRRRLARLWAQQSCSQGAASSTRSRPISPGNNQTLVPQIPVTPMTAIPLAIPSSSQAALEVERRNADDRLQRAQAALSQPAASEEQLVQLREQLAEREREARAARVR